MLTWLKSDSAKRALIRGFLIPFAALMIPGALGWLNDLTHWASNNGQTPFPDVHSLAFVGVQAIVAGVISLVNLAWNFVEDASGHALARTPGPSPLTTTPTEDEEPSVVDKVAAAKAATAQKIAESKAPPAPAKKVAAKKAPAKKAAKKAPARKAPAKKATRKKGEDGRSTLATSALFILALGVIVFLLAVFDVVVVSSGVGVGMVICGVVLLLLDRFF